MAHPRRNGPQPRPRRDHPRTAERLRANHAISASLTGITAAVVGVIANLAVYFALHTLFTTIHPHRWGPVHLQLPDPTTIRPVPLAITAVAGLLLFRLHWPVLRTLAVCATLGILGALAGLPVA